MAEENDNINPGPIDQSRQLVDQIQESIRTILQLTKQLGLSQEAQNSIAEEYNNKLGQAQGNTNLLQQLNEELSNRINSIAQNTDEYASDISSVSSELDRIVGSISTTSDFSRTVLKDFKSLRDTAFNIRNDRDLTRVMSIEELNNSKEQVGIDQKSLEIQVQRASAELDFNAIINSIKQTQQDIVSAVLEQDNAIRSANGRLGGQTRQLNEIKSYFSQINELATNENINSERAIELSEQRNQISSVLEDALNNNITKNVKEEEIVRSIIEKLGKKEQILDSEENLINQILDRKEQGFKEERDEIVKASQVTKENLTQKSQQLDLARSIITELRTEGKLSNDSNGSIQEKVAILEQNQDLLKGLSSTEKTRLVKAIESNKVLANNKTLYETLTSEIESSIAREKDLAKTMGVTGSIVKEFSKIPVLASVFKAEDVKEVTDEVRRLNKEYQDKASLETAKNRNELVTTFTQIQETSNILTEDESKQLADITQKIESKQKLTKDEIRIAQNLSAIVLENTDIEEKRREVLDKISTLNEEDKKSLETLTSKIEERKTLTEEELKLLEEKTGVNTENLNINDKILTNIKEQGVNIEVNAQKVTQLGAASRMLGKVMGNLKQTLTDPAAILSAIGAALLRNSQLTNQFQQELGIGYGNALAMRNALSNAAGASGDLFINSEKLQKSFFALKESTGVFFDLTSQSAETFTNLTERIGLAGNEAGNLVMLTRLQGKETENVLGNLYDTTGAMLQTSKTTATVKDILGDVAKASKGLQASLSANPQALAKAAIAAREFGSTLSELEGIQKNLLNFESSIEAELKAELLTGKQLNLEKARAAALNNDMKTLGEELKKQNVDLASFGEMNVLQQEAIAEAMGMNRDSLAETLLKQEMQGKTLEEIRSTMGEQAYEQAKALSAQDKFNAAVAKVKDLFTNVMTALTPVIDVLAAMLQPIAWVAKWLGKINELTGGWSNALIGVAIAAKALGMSFGSLFNPATYTSFFKGISENVGSLSFGGIKDKITGAFAPGSTDGFFSGIKERFKGLTEPLKGLKNKLMGAFTGAADKAAGIEFDPRMAGGGRFRDMGTGRMVSEEVANAAGVFKPGEGPAAAAKGVADKTSAAAEKAGKAAAPKDNGKALKEKMQNIAKGLKAFADPKVVLGGLSLLASSPGLIALGIASVPLKLVEKINAKALQAGMRGIATGLVAFANPMAVVGGLALIPISAGLATMAVGAIGLAGIALLGVPAAAGMTALGAGLATLGAVAATGLPFLGVALIGALGAALIPFGIALAATAPLVTAVGTAIAGVLTSIAGAVTTVLPVLTTALIDLATKIPLDGLLGLALALPGLALGVGLLGVTLLTSAPGLLAGALILPMVTASLASIPEVNGENLLMVGAGVAALAGGLTLLGVAAPLALAGAGVLSLVSLALIPLGAALSIVSPTLDIFTTSIQKLGEVDGGNLIGLAAGIGTLGFVVSGLAVMSPLIMIGSGALVVLGLSAKNAAESMKLLDGISSDSMIGFAKSLGILGSAAALLGTMAPLVALGSGTIYLLGKVIDPAAEAMKKIADVGANSMIGFATSVSILGGAATRMGILAPLIALGAGTIHLLGQSLEPAAVAMQNLAGISAESMIGFAGAIGVLGTAATMMGAMAPLVALGTGTIYLLGQAIAPATEAMQNLVGISADSMVGFSVALNLLGNAAAGMGLLAPLVVLGAGAMTVLGMAIVPAAEAMKNLAGISADAILAFTFGLSQLSTTTALIGAFAPVIALGAGAIFLLGKAIAPAAEAMKNLAGISADAILGFSTGLSMLGSTASMLGIVAPLVVLGAGALYVLGNALVPAAKAFAILEGLNASTMLGFAGTLTVLGTAAALFGALSPAILLGAGALYVLGNAIVPAAETFKLLEGLDPAVMTGFASSLFVLGSSAAFFGGLFPLVLLGAGAIAILGLALKPLAELAPKLNLTNTALAGIAGSIGLLGAALTGLDTSKLTELAEFGESLNITSNVITETPTLPPSTIPTTAPTPSLAETTTLIPTTAPTPSLAETPTLPPPSIPLTTPTPSLAEITTLIPTETSPTESINPNISGVISENVRAAVVEVLREKLPSGEFKVTTTLQNLDTGETTTESAISRNENIARSKAELEGRANFVRGTNITPAAPGFQPVTPPNVGENPRVSETSTVQQGVTAEEIEGIVASTIKALVPEMVAAMSNVKVVNDNFHNSKQSEGPSRNRQITNNNFA